MSTGYISYQVQNCYYSYMVSLNPADGELEVALAEDESLTKAASWEEGVIRKITIASDVGDVVKEFSSSARQGAEPLKKVTLNVKDLKDGVYYVSIFNKKSKQTKRVLIKH